MRIVQVAPTYAPCVGGAERLLEEVSVRLVARGHEVSVLTFDATSHHDLRLSQGAGLPDHELRRGVRIRRLAPDGGRRNKLLQWWLRQHGGWRTTHWLFPDDFEFRFERPSGFSVQQALRDVEADVITSVNWHYGAPLWALRASRRRRIPHVAIPNLHVERRWAQRAIYARMLPSCAAAIALTEAEASFLKARGARSVAVAGGGVDPASFAHADGAAFRARHALGAFPVVGFVGRQDELKGVPTLLDAMAIVWRTMPEARLLLAGPRAHRDRPVSDRLQALSTAERQRVVLVDDFPDGVGPALMAACDLLAQPSLEESFGLVLVEAWICERPVIAADIAASRALVEPGVDGWLVPPRDAAALAAKITELLADPHHRAKLGANGRQKVLARFTWDRIAEQWEAVLERAVHAI